MPKRKISEQLEWYGKIIKLALLVLVAFGGSFAGIAGNYRFLSELFGTDAVIMMIIAVFAPIGILSIAIIAILDIMRRLNKKDKE